MGFVSWLPWNCVGLYPCTCCCVIGCCWARACVGMFCTPVPPWQLPGPGWICGVGVGDCAPPSEGDACPPSGCGAICPVGVTGLVPCAAGCCWLFCVPGAFIPFWVAYWDCCCCAIFFCT